MKSIYKLILIIILAVFMLPGEMSGQVAFPAPGSFILYPPLNFQASQVECAGYLHWQKPQLPNGTTPAGLLGYYIFRDGVVIDSLQGGNLLEYYDYLCDYGPFAYSVTAKYDLAFYGVPGQYGQSSPSGPVTVTIICSRPLPFQEFWDQGNFSFNSWNFTPSLSNWTISTTLGNPVPTALFQGTPALQNYNNLMYSCAIPGEPWTCATMWLEFDCMLSDISAGATEKLSVEYFIEGAWHQALELKNEGTTGWTHHKVDISAVCGKKFRFGFRLSGSSSANIAAWYIDNIVQHPECHGPVNCSVSPLPHGAHVSWDPPVCDGLQNLVGYNIYRTDGTGNPVFSRLNSTPVTATEYIDNYPGTVTTGIFQYLVEDIIRNPNDGLILCTAFCDTLNLTFSVGVAEDAANGIRIYPLPANQWLTISGPENIVSVELYSMIGKPTVFEIQKAGSQVMIPLNNLPSGLYMVHFRTHKTHYERKITILR